MYVPLEMQEKNCSFRKDQSRTPVILVPGLGKNDKAHKGSFISC